MKIFLDCLAATPCISVGTNAFIITDIQLLNRKYPGCETVLFSSNPQLDKLQFGHLPFKISYVQRSPNQVVAMFQMRKIVSQVDAVVSAWGDGYITTPPYKLFRKALFLKKKGVPLVLFTSSIGPFDGGYKDKIAIMGLRKFDAVTVRDQNTFDYLKPYGLKRFRLVHDTAFVLEPCTEQRSDELLSQTGLKGEKFIGLNISVLFYNLFKEQGGDYISLMVRYIEWMREKLKLPIVLIPHQIYPKGFVYTQDEYQAKNGDDRYPIERIFSTIRDQSGVFALQQEMTPQEMKGVIGKSEVFVGGRMHSVIAAVSLSVPSLVMQYSHKSGGMMKLLGMAEFGWDIHDEFEILTEKTFKLWKNRHDIHIRYKEMMPGIYQEIYDLTDELDIIAGGFSDCEV